MDRLPRELLGLILLWDVRMCRCEKNTVLPLRLVCKAFDLALKPYIFKTIQLEFSRFLRDKAAPSIESIARVGDICNAVYIDMMVIRDEGMLGRRYVDLARPRVGASLVCRNRINPLAIS